MARISGIYANGFGEPVAGVCILLTARATSSGVVMTTTASQVTAADGSYVFDLRAGVYIVTASSAYLGVITVSTDSPDGTLNDYLAAYDPATLAPAVVDTVQELVKEAQAAAKAAEDAAAKAAEDAKDAAADAASAKSSVDDIAKNFADMNLVKSVNGSAPDEEGKVTLYGPYVSFFEGVNEFKPKVEGFDTEFVYMHATRDGCKLTLDLTNFTHASMIYRLRVALGAQTGLTAGITLSLKGISSNRIWDTDGVYREPADKLYPPELAIIDIWRAPGSTIPIVQIVFSGTKP